MHVFVKVYLKKIQKIINLNIVYCFMKRVPLKFYLLPLLKYSLVRTDLYDLSFFEIKDFERMKWVEYGISWSKFVA
jgi:hypothetical protein